MRGVDIPVELLLVLAESQRHVARIGLQRAIGGDVFYATVHTTLIVDIAQAGDFLGYSNLRPQVVCHELDSVGTQMEIVNVDCPTRVGIPVVDGAVSRQGDALVLRSYFQF